MISAFGQISSYFLTSYKTVDSVDREHSAREGRPFGSLYIDSLHIFQLPVSGLNEKDGGR